jgi:hypothetical protein
VAPSFAAQRAVALVAFELVVIARTFRSTVAFAIDRFLDGVRSAIRSLRIEVVTKQYASERVCISEWQSYRAAHPNTTRAINRNALSHRGLRAYSISARS